MPVASWGRCHKPLEKMESHVLLELKALREGTWKMGEFTAFSKKLSMQVTPELWALLKVVPKAHLELQAMLIDVQQYKPTWGCWRRVPPCLKSWTSQAATPENGNSWTTRWTWTTCTALSLP